MPQHIISRFLNHEATEEEIAGQQTKDGDLILHVGLRLQRVSSQQSEERGQTQYVVQELLGAGRFSQVVACESEQKQRVAIKIAKITSSCTQAALREIKVLKSIQSTGAAKYVNTMIDSFEEQRGHTCIVLEFLESSLLDLLLYESKLQGFSFEYIACWGRDLLTALAQLHAAGVAHCDIKPENLLIKDLSLILCDFNSAQFLSDTENSNLLRPLTTKNYIAPEFLNNLSVSGDISPVETNYQQNLASKKEQNMQTNNLLKADLKKLDAWSAGCVLAEMYLGKPLFQDQAKNCSSIAQKIEELQQLLVASPYRVKQNYSYLQKQFTLFSNLLLHLLQPDPLLRISVGQALEHDFFILIKSLN